MGAMYASHFAGAGFEVLLVAGGERAERLRAGLVVNDVPLVAEVVDADQPGTVAPADLVIFAVKDRQLDAAMDDAGVVIGPRTALVSVLNGLDSEQLIASRFGADNVLLCVALGMDAERDGPRIRYRQPGRLLIGRASNPEDEPVDSLLASVQDALDRAGLAWVTPPDMVRQLWWKFMVNTGVNQASAVLRAPYGAFQHDGDARDLMLALIAEVVEVSVAESVGLTDEDVAAWLDVLAGMPAQGWTSMRQDVEAGRPTEVGSFAGRVVELGAAHGIATPYNQAMLWILRGGVPSE